MKEINLNEKYNMKVVKGEEKMSTENKILMLYRCETPLHVGSGDEMGIVDLPIQREKHTGFPKMEASGIKGVFRDKLERELGKENENICIIFGSDGEIRSGEEEKKSEAGGLIFTDARLLLFPVRAGRDVFRWITCPYVLQRFAREWNLTYGENECDILSGINLKILNDLEKGNVYEIKKKGQQQSNSQTKREKKISLDEFQFNVKEEISSDLLEIVEKIIIDNYLKEKLNKGIVLVSDEVFSYFTEMNTQVDTRIRIGDDGVVEDGALFTEEFLPEESVLYSAVEEWKDGALQAFTEGLEIENFFMQFGGDMTIGKGITEVHIYKKENDSEEKKEGGELNEA